MFVTKNCYKGHSTRARVRAQYLVKKLTRFPSILTRAGEELAHSGVVAHASPCLASSNNSGEWLRMARACSDELAGDLKQAAANSL